jgi:hypothetical protein
LQQTATTVVAKSLLRNRGTTSVVRLSQRWSSVLDGCPMFAPAYMGRKRIFSNAFTPLHQDCCTWPQSFCPGNKSLGRGCAPSLEFLHFPGVAGTAESWQDRTHSCSVRCAFLSSPRAATAVCSVESRRDGLIIAQHAVLGSQECVDQSRKGRLKLLRRSTI